MGKLQGKVAVITGGTEGIGLATAQLFVNEGAYVFITGRRQKELDEAVTPIGSNATGVQGDVAKLADLDRLYQTRQQGEGPLGASGNLHFAVEPGQPCALAGQWLITSQLHRATECSAPRNGATADHESFPHAFALPGSSP
jgi:NAD(P)-dependent dehydrogenase (short-subunit alcohol dehydrogenase family)